MTKSFYVALVVLKLLILVPQPPEYWDYRHACAPCLTGKLFNQNYNWMFSIK
jgi:hypothetical protein